MFCFLKLPADFQNVGEKEARQASKQAGVGIRMCQSQQRPEPPLPTLKSPDLPATVPSFFPLPPPVVMGHVTSDTSRDTYFGSGKGGYGAGTARAEWRRKRWLQGLRLPVVGMRQEWKSRVPFPSYEVLSDWKWKFISPGFFGGGWAASKVLD